MKGETKSNSRASAPAHQIDIRIIFSRVFLSFSSSFVHAKPLNFEMFTDDDERWQDILKDEKQTLPP